MASLNPEEYVCVSTAPITTERDVQSHAARPTGRRRRRRAKRPLDSELAIEAAMVKASVADSKPIKVVDNAMKQCSSVSAAPTTSERDVQSPAARPKGRQCRRRVIRPIDSELAEEAALIKAWFADSKPIEIVDNKAKQFAAAHTHVHDADMPKVKPFLPQPGSVKQAGQDICSSFSAGSMTTERDGSPAAELAGEPRRAMRPIDNELAIETAIVKAWVADSKPIKVVDNEMEQCSSVSAAPTTSERDVQSPAARPKGRRRRRRAKRPLDSELAIEAAMVKASVADSKPIKVLDNAMKQCSSVSAAPTTSERDVQSPATRPKGRRCRRRVMRPIDSELAEEAAIVKAWFADSKPIEIVDNKAEQLAAAHTHVHDADMPKVKPFLPQPGSVRQTGQDICSRFSAAPMTTERGGSPAAELAGGPRQVMRPIDWEFAEVAAIVKAWVADSKPIEVVDTKAEQLATAHTHVHDAAMPRAELFPPGQGSVKQSGQNINSSVSAVSITSESDVRSHAARPTGRRRRVLGPLERELAKEKALVKAWVAGSNHIEVADIEAEELEAAGIHDGAMPRAESIPPRRRAYWWCLELSELRAANVSARRAYTRYRRRKVRDPIQEGNLYQTYRAACVSKQVAIAQAKEAAWEEWCKPNWELPELSPEAFALLKQCAELPETTPSDDIEELIEKSNAFPIPFPIETVRLAELKKRKSLDELKKNIASTYPIVHERVLRLMALFLVYKRDHGSSIEKKLYKNMTIPELIDRILQKRAICFFSRHDIWMLIDGTEGNNGWEAIGTSKEKPPLTLASCLSYDELKLSAMLYVSSHTTCINNGTRKNLGVVNEDNIEDNPVIIGVIGPRFQREGKMECEDILITVKQNCMENGYGNHENEEADTSSYITGLLKKILLTQSNEKSKVTWRKLWADFYEVPNSTYPEVLPKFDSQLPKNENLNKNERECTDRFISVTKFGATSIFDNEIYHKRLSIIAETALIEANVRAKDAEKNAFLNIIGAGLGVWKISAHQNDMYVISFMQTIRALLRQGALNHVTDVNFAYFDATDILKATFNRKPDGVISTFIRDKEHPKKGIKIYLQRREPSSKLTGEHEGKLLVMTYAWDGNAHPGNEFWMRNLGSSGDPAAACSTQISELHNAHINPRVRSAHTRVLARAQLLTLTEYAQNLS